MSSDEARTALVSAIKHSLSEFPQDLRVLYSAAIGITDDKPLLEDRVAAMCHKLDRSPRALRRRLRQAEQLLADALMRDHGVLASEKSARGWQWISQDLELVLGVSARLDMRRTILALEDHQKFLTEMIFVNEIQDDDSIDIEVLQGAEMVALDESVRGRWAFTLQMARELSRGEELATRVRVTLSRARALSPFVVLSPARPTRTATIRVDLGTPLVGERPWVVDGVFPAAVMLPDPARVEIAVDQTRRVERTFTKLQVGLAYGIGWHWVD